NHYYPFGMKHSVYVPADKKIFGLNPGEEELKIKVVTKTDYLYKYNGKEWQDELGLNMYAMDMRQYDPAIARWVVQDPVVHLNQSPYSSFDGNPVYWADPSGADTESWLKDIFNRSQSGDVWTNNGSGTFTNNRNGETSECDDCEAKDGPLKGKKLKNYIGVNFSGNEYIPWQGEKTYGILLEPSDFSKRILELLNDYELLEKLMNYSGYAVGGLAVTDFKNLIKSPYSRNALLAGISIYLKIEGNNLNETQKTMTEILANYILIGGSPQIYEITTKYNSTFGFSDFTQKSFYTENGDFLGGWKRTIFNTKQQKPTIINEK
ncbi:MAG: RHS repeat-associated core domain-containing protein, partial [Weeksellaceae bacterium]